jgi:sporulation protein YlmC with PRC-barrel domain
MLKSAGISLFTLLLTLPTMAQTPAGVPTTGHDPQIADMSEGVTDLTGMRASKILGAPVYNDHNEKVGSVDDVVIGNDKTLNVIVSVGGFLGLGSKMVEIPFDKLQFGYEKGSSDNRIVIAGVTKESLTAMPDYHYAIRS